MVIFLKNILGGNNSILRSILVNDTHDEKVHFQETLLLIEL